MAQMLPMIQVIPEMNYALDPVTGIIGLIGWIISFRAFVLASCNDAASTKWSGLWPKVEQ